MFYVNTGNKSIYASPVTGALPSPQGISNSAVDVDLTQYPPVRRTALSISAATVGDIYYPVNIFKWADATSVTCATRMTDEDRATFMSNGPAAYAVFGPADTRSDAEVIVARLSSRGLRAAVRVGNKIVGEDNHGVFELPGMPSGDTILVSDFTDRHKDMLEEITLLGAIKQYVIDDRDEASIDVAATYEIVPVGDPGVAKFAVVAGDPVLYRVVARKPDAGVRDNQSSTQTSPDGRYRADDHRLDHGGVPGGQEDDVRRDMQSGSRPVITGHTDHVARHGTVGSLLAILNGAQFLALNGSAAVRSALVERAIAEADVIATDIITVNIVYPIKLDTYVDEELGQRYERSIVLDDQNVTITVVKRMSRARRFMSWFVIPTAIAAGIVTIVKDSISIGRGRV